MTKGEGSSTTTNTSASAEGASTTAGVKRSGPGNQDTAIPKNRASTLKYLLTVRMICLQTLQDLREKW
jgi:hypothetical protein